MTTHASTMHPRVRWTRWTSRTSALALGLLAALALTAPAAQGQARGQGSAVLSDTEAASRVDRSSWEPRQRNWRENRRTPTPSELQQFFDRNHNWGRCGERLKRNVTGRFTGTTDEIIQWAAHKWGIDRDIIRAVTVKESYWNQDAAADWDRYGTPQSFGLTQIRRQANPGTYPLSKESTAFALDYYGASLRFYYDGCADWLRGLDGNWSYGGGDIWGAVGAWYSGRWYNGGARWYIGEIKNVLSSRTWERF